MLWTPWAQGQDAVLVGAGDIAACGGPLKRAEATARVLDGVVEEESASESPRELVVFTAGDNAYERGSDKEFRECYGKTWGRHRSRTRPAAGNHDFRTRKGQGYFDYFGDAAGPTGLGYYSYQLGTWHVVVLNSVCKKVGGCDPGSEQLKWLEDDLSSSSSPCAVAYFHHPLFSSGRSDEEQMTPIYETLYRHGVDLVLSGHDHHYERFALQDPQGRPDPQEGFRQFVVGSGGRGKRFFVRDSLRLKPNSEVATNDEFGVLKLTLRPGAYDWEFLAIEGSSFTDSGSGSCR